MGFSPKNEFSRLDAALHGLVAISSTSRSTFQAKGGKECPSPELSSSQNL
jgi:hypothetical protein